ncbi:HAD family hydrolase [Rhizobium rhizosphaerae]|uniref:HAD family hydrolase n=1 Tax=Xaviernesmea rhizosphaerae TaxID=1672749 RepID=A0A1Q9AHN1_9HYPH|nr:HAD family phosphatase [Xaviernesmea rhizosphaerae]OLP54716.1 HAD family hydrolase [Xaviernesmea rhizosphaerae]
MPARFQAVAWDIDGTLVDSEPLHHRALVSASLEFGTDLRNLPDMAFRGIHMGDVWQLLRDRLPPSLAEEVWAHAINRHYVAGRRTLRPLPGAVETIRALHRQGVPQVCVSNSCRLVVDANLDALDVAACMTFSISLDDVTEGKPSPLPYAGAAERLGLAPETVVAVEDSATGIRSARAAGLHALFLRTSDNGGVWAGEPKPDGMLEALTDLLAFFPQKVPFS